MQKTKLGISAGLFAALVYFLGYFSGYLVTALLVGYVLLREENVWLKKNAVKALALMVCFSLTGALIGFIPNIITFINSVVAVFGGSFSITFVSRVINVINNGLDLIEKVLFLLLGLFALNETAIPIPGLDGLVDKYMDQ